MGQCRQLMGKHACHASLQPETSGLLKLGLVASLGTLVFALWAQAQLPMTAQTVGLGVPQAWDTVD